MKISLLSLIIGLILGVLIIGFLYYGAYKSFEIYFKIRHPLKKSSAEGPSPKESEIITPPKDKLYLSEWMSIPNNDEFINEGEVYLFGKDKDAIRSISIDKTRKFLELTDFNSTDSLQKWKLFFFKNPNDPRDETEGIIYNTITNKYISLEDGDIKLKDLSENYKLNVPLESFNVKVIQDKNKISDKSKNLWITTSDSPILKTTGNKKNAMEFFVAII